MPTPFLRRGLPAILAPLLFLFPRPAHAGVDLEVGSVLGEVRSENELLVRIRNPERREIHGTIAIEDRSPIPHVLARTPFVAAPAASSFVKVPLATPAYGTELVAVARDEAGREVGRAIESSRGSGNFVLLELPPKDTKLLPFHIDPRGSAALRRIGGNATITTAPADETTGAHILPDRPSSYAHVAIVVAPASELESLAGADRDVLVGWVKGGGALAIAVREPADLARPVLVSLVGAGVQAAPFERRTPDQEELEEKEDEDGSVSAATPAVQAKLSGFAGGRLRRSRFGAVADVGLGNVHLLAIDPWSKEANGDRWVQTQIVDVVADEPARTAIGHTSLDDGFYSEPIIRALDANDSFRLALAIATLILVLYAIVVGPILFRRLAKRGPVLAPYRWTVMASAATFTAVVVIGLVAKGGFGSRSRGLALVEVASGEPLGVLRSYRSFYGSSGQVISIAAHAPRSAFAEPSVRGATVATSATGASTLEHVAVRPWETVVVREDATITIGQGITITQEGVDLVVTNRSGIRIRDAIISSAELGCLGLGTIDDGARASSHGASRLEDTICSDEKKLPPAWRAFHSAFVGRPARASLGRPTLLGELESPVVPEPGFRSDRHDVLVRVVGGAS